MPKDLLRKLTDRLNVDKNDTRVAGGRYHNFKDLMKFPDCGRSDLKYPALLSRLQTGTERDGKYPETDQETGPVAALPLSIVRYRDPCIARGSHQQRSEKHQDDSLSPYQRLEGSESSDLRCTKRKKVTVIIELLARFDEASNISWSKRMQEAGIKVIFGVEGLKIHSKLVHIGTRFGDLTLYQHRKLS